MGDRQNGKAESSQQDGTAAAQKGVGGVRERKTRNPVTATRRRGKIDRLPARVREEVNALLLDPKVRYEDIRNFLKTQGYDVSTMSVCRYGRRFMEEVRAMRVAEEQARALIARRTEKGDGCTSSVIQ